MTDPFGVLLFQLFSMKASADCVSVCLQPSVYCALSYPRATVKGDVLANYVTVKGTFDGHMECSKLLIVR